MLVGVQKGLAFAAVGDNRVGVGGVLDVRRKTSSTFTNDTGRFHRRYERLFIHAILSLPKTVRQAAARFRPTALPGISIHRKSLASHRGEGLERQRELGVVEAVGSHGLHGIEGNALVEAEDLRGGLVHDLFADFFADVEILVEGVLGLHENEEKIQEEKRRN